MMNISRHDLEELDDNRGWNQKEEMRVLKKQKSIKPKNAKMLKNPSEKGVVAKAVMQEESGKVWALLPLTQCGVMHAFL